MFAASALMRSANHDFHFPNVRNGSPPALAVVTLVAIAAAVAIGFDSSRAGLERHARIGLAMHPACPGVHVLHPHCRGAGASVAGGKALCPRRPLALGMADIGASR